MSEYEEAINALIPQASRMADYDAAVVYGALWPSMQRALDHWDRVYHKAMNTLAQEAGLRFL